MPKKQLTRNAKKAPKKRGRVNRLTAELTEILRQDYVHGIEDENGERVYPSIKALAVKYHVSLSSAFNRSSDNNWMADREISEQRYREEIDAKKRLSLVNQAVEFDSNSLNLAKALQAEIFDLLKISQEMNEKKRGQGDDVDSVYRYLSNYAISQLATALETTQRIGRLAVGQSTENLNVSDSADLQKQIEGVSEVIKEATINSPKFEGFDRGLRLIK
tara:strand:+ start:253 stop:906 length:654 start_codon:yes stop_codon:yes gene_type:complete